MKSKIFSSIVLASLSFAATAETPGVYEDTAEVTQVSINTRDVTRNQRVCEDVMVESRGQGQNVMGTVIGGVAGGILGNQVGKGNGRTVSTAAGAVIGSVVGNNLANNSNQNAMQTRSQCHNVRDVVTEQNGYLVTYEYQGRSFQAVYPRDPGRTVRVNVSVSPR